MAIGSSVPAWPILRVRRIRRSRATTSWLVSPAGLSTITSPASTRTILPIRSTAASPLPQHLLLVGHIEAMAVGHVLPDGRELFADVSFRVGEGVRVALVGPNGAGKTTLLRMVAGEISPATGSIARAGGLGVMSQFVGAPTADDRTLADLALSLAPPPVRAAGGRLRAAEAALDDTERSQVRYADALVAWGEAGGYDGGGGVRHGVGRGARAAVGEGAAPAHHARSRAASRSGSRWSCCCAGPDEVLLLDEPDNYLDVPGKRWLEDAAAGLAEERAAT